MRRHRGAGGSRGSRAAGCGRSVLSSGLGNSLSLSARAAGPARRVGPGVSRNSKLPSCGPERSLNLPASLFPSGRHVTAVRVLAWLGRGESRESQGAVATGHGGVLSARQGWPFEPIELSPFQPRPKAVHVWVDRVLSSERKKRQDRQDRSPSESHRQPLSSIRGHGPAGTFHGPAGTFRGRTAVPVVPELEGRGRRPLSLSTVLRGPCPRRSQGERETNTPGSSFLGQEAWALWGKRVLGAPSRSVPIVLCAQVLTPASGTSRQSQQDRARGGTLRAIRTPFPLLRFPPDVLHSRVTSAALAVGELHLSY